MPVNRFQIERFDGMVVIHFGLIDTAGVLRDRYSCGIFKVELEAQKESMMAYLGRLGSLAEAPPAWQAPLVLGPIDVCNHIGCTSNPDLAETTFNNVVVRAINEIRQDGGGHVEADPVALLRSTQQFQMHLIRELYPDALHDK